MGRETCEELKRKLRIVGKKVTGNRAVLKHRLKEVLVTNDKGWESCNKASCKTLHHLESGTFRDVYLQRYTRGPRRGELCVKQRFKTGSVYEAEYFKNDLKMTEVAADIIKKFVKEVPGTRIFLNEPEVWYGKRGTHGKRERFIVEPYLKGKYVKFNSNTGYNDESWKRMQALTHFSYHITEREMILCDLQGVHAEDGIYMLTDPAICSKEKRFGPADLGKEGIRNFFAYHKCNKYCEKHWRTSDHAKKYFTPIKGTTFT